jgi:sugar phosphate isomerase/epimerase
VTVLGTAYRLGTTSYIWPAGLLPNVRRLGPWIDDVELVLFDLEEQSNLPDAETAAELRALARTHDLTYTVHLPLDLHPAHPLSMEKAEKVIGRTRDLSPRAYVLHLDGRAVEGTPDRATLANWRRGARQALRAVAEMVDDPRDLCIENLENYPPEHLLPLLDETPASLCVDVGHLWLTGRDPLAFLATHLDRTRVIHLHGTGERDHQSLLHQGLGPVAAILALLADRRYDGVLTLEVFGREDFFSSRELVCEVVNGTH